jgi:hypothetical protein
MSKPGTCHGHDVFPDHVCTDLCTDNLCCVTLGTVTPPATCDYWYDSENRCNRPTDETGRCDEHYRSQAARDARRAGYGDASYWKYLDRAAQEHYDYFMARGDTAKAESMFTESLSEALRGNDGN